MIENADSNLRGAEADSVSVVIPTVGRPEVVRALHSAREQRLDGMRLEVVVVHDGERGSDLLGEVYGLADRVLRTTGHEGGARARNMGINAATGHLIALLDDDDEWLPHKLQAQVSVWRQTSDPEHTIVGGRQVYVNARTGDESRPGPTRLVGSEESIEHYLFRRRPPNGGRPSMYTSTLLCPKSLATSVPWDDSLRRHQDWDWLIRLGRDPRVRFVQVPESVVRIHLGSSDSISASSDWKSSLDWADRTLRSDMAVYADFVAAQPLRYALGSRSWQGVRIVTAALKDAKRLPSLGPVAIGLAGILSRNAIERATVRTGGVKPGSS